MQHQDIRTIEAGAVAVPILTRREKLLRWASLVRAAPHPMRLLHLLEDMPKASLAQCDVIGSQTPFGVAANDPLFRTLGLGNSIADNMSFFEVTQSQLHEFSCDCGGHIDNAQMADRIERLVGA